jgi:hypothetical protein
MSQDNDTDLFATVVGSPLPAIDTPVSSLEAHHHDFRSLVMLLNLVTSINNQGHPTLGSFLESHGALEHPQPFESLLLNAFACVLVQNSEVIAAIGTSAFDLGLFAMDGRQISDPADIDNMDAKYIEAAFPITTVGNPDRNPKVLPRPPSDADCMTFDPQQSYWKNIMDDGWWALDHLSGYAP